MATALTLPATDFKLSGAQWRVLSLLVVSVFINYVDRGSISIAAPLLKDELGLSPAELGLLLSAFFWMYAPFQIVSGWLVDRFEVTWVLAGGFFLWSVATVATGLVHGFAALFVLRLILGIGESVAYPSYSKILARDFAEHHRGLANALIDAGCRCGPGLGTLLGGVLMARFGWRPFFVVLGLMSLFWLLPWSRWKPEGRTSDLTTSDQAPSVMEILRERSAWGTIAGLFCANYFWYFLLTWLPFYLVRERHFSMESMATLGAIAYLTIAVSTSLCGCAADRWIRSGASPTCVRKTFAGSGLAFSTLILPVAVIADPTISVLLLFFVCACYGIFSCSHWAITQTLAGPLAAGKWTGIQNGVGNLAGVVAPALTGVVVQRTGHFFWAFVVSGAVVLTGSMMFVFLVGAVEPVKWRARGHATRHTQTSSCAICPSDEGTPCR
jgi:MFS family permease